MNRRAFYYLLQRYLDGHCTDEEKKLVEQWYELLDDDHDPAITPEEVKASVDKLWPKVKEQTFAQAVPVKVRPLRPYRRWLSAAAALLLVVLGAWWWSTGSSVSVAKEKTASQQGFRTFTNERTANYVVYLSDSSMVVLEPQATIRYPNSFATQKREVYLEGNAFFKVTKNAAAPFYVYSNHLVTQVLGTSFFIKNNQTTNDIEVSVRTGKVAVYSEESTGVILKPNQKVVYNQNDRLFRTSLVDMPLPLVPDSSKEESVTVLNFVFEEEPLANVLARLEAAYHIEITLEQPVLGKALFTGDIKGQNLFDQLEIICQSIQATYEIKGTQILIKASPDG